MPFGDGTGPLGQGPGYWGPYGRGRGWRPGFYQGRCWNYPWLPRWWWANPEYQQNYPYPPEPTPKEEKGILTEELQLLKEEMKAIEQRLKELETKKKK